VSCSWGADDDGDPYIMEAIDAWLQVRTYFYVEVELEMKVLSMSRDRRVWSPCLPLATVVQTAILLRHHRIILVISALCFMSLNLFLSTSIPIKLIALSPSAFSLETS
jgi:hypothetical protein